MEKLACKLCGELKELQYSHVIGKSVFRTISQRSGKHYGLLTDPEKNKIIRSTDQWASLMLCEGCESLLNSRYENYSLWVLKNKQKGVKHQDTNACLLIKNVNQIRLMLYVISIFWRAAVSEHNVFKGVVISPELSSYLKRCLLGEENINANLFSVRISKLIDKRDHYSEDLLKGVITNLVSRPISNGESYIMFFSGFYFEIFIGGLNVTDRYEFGILKKNKRILRIPYKDIFSIPELLNSFAKTREIAIRDKAQLTFI
ncbi:MAG TPA: hypothetical protein H9887_08335 [Candidatus Dorea intestinavium]|nr:hypothetical protein [Candidatus Dorea intestinavium]